MTIISKACGVLLPHAVDNLAETSPGAIFCLHPISSDISEGWQSVTFKSLAKAANNLAWWIENKVGQSKNIEVLAYVGANDMRYAIFILACLKTGHVVSVYSIIENFPTDWIISYTDRHSSHLHGIQKR